MRLNVEQAALLATGQGRQPDPDGAGCVPLARAGIAQIVQRFAARHQRVGQDRGVIRDKLGHLFGGALYQDFAILNRDGDGGRRAFLCLDLGGLGLRAARCFARLAFLFGFSFVVLCAADLDHLLGERAFCQRAPAIGQRDGQFAHIARREQH